MATCIILAKYGRWGVLTVLIAPPPQAMLLVAYQTSSSCNKGHVVLNVLGTRQASADSYPITSRPSDVKRHWTGLFLGLIEKKWLRPWSACLQVQRFTGVIFIIQCSHFLIPKLYFIEREANSIIGKVALITRYMSIGSAMGFPYAVNRRPTASQMFGGNAYQWLWYARV